jgi:hypothetical protein
MVPLPARRRDSFQPGGQYVNPVTSSGLASAVDSLVILCLFGYVCIQSGVGGGVYLLFLGENEVKEAFENAIQNFFSFF